MTALLWAAAHTWAFFIPQVSSQSALPSRLSRHLQHTTREESSLRAANVSLQPVPLAPGAARGCAGGEQLCGARAKGVGRDFWQVQLLREKHLEAPPVMLSGEVAPQWVPGGHQAAGAPQARMGASSPEDRGWWPPKTKPFCRGQAVMGTPKPVGGDTGSSPA